MKRSSFLLFSAALGLIATFVFAIVSGIHRDKVLDGYRERAARADSYCRLVKISFQGYIEFLQAPATRQVRAEYIRQVIEKRISYDDIMQCTPKLFDHERFTDCISHDDYACAKAVIDQHLATFTLEPP